MFWLLGSLGQATWSDRAIHTVVVLIGCVYLLVQARALNAIVLGDDAALSFGFAAHRLRWILLGSASLVTGVLVALVEDIGFVGLVIPHLIRLVVPITAEYFRLPRSSARYISSPSTYCAASSYAPSNYRSAS